MSSIKEIVENYFNKMESVDDLLSLDKNKLISEIQKHCILKEDLESLKNRLVEERRVAYKANTDSGRQSALSLSLVLTRLNKLLNKGESK